LIGLCLVFALVINVGAAIQQRTHPEIMQAVSATNTSLRQNVEAANATGIATDAAALAGLFREAIPIYESRQLAGAVTLAGKAAAAADEAVAAANAGNMEAAGSFAGTAGKACGGCHMQFREKAPDGTYRFKAQP
jgi:cytochrome c556